MKLYRVKLVSGRFKIQRAFTPTQLAFQSSLLLNLQRDDFIPRMQIGELYMFVCPTTGGDK